MPSQRELSARRLTDVAYEPEKWKGVKNVKLPQRSDGKRGLVKTATPQKRRI